MCDIIDNYINQGREKGREEGREDVIRSMIQNGVSVEDIAKFTNLPIETVRKVKKKMHRKKARSLTPSAS